MTPSRGLRLAHSRVALEPGGEEEVEVVGGRLSGGHARRPSVGAREARIGIEGRAHGPGGAMQPGTDGPRRHAEDLRGSSSGRPR